jgi:hypothetical protein
MDHCKELSNALREGERDRRGREPRPAPWLEELDPAAIGEGEGVSVEGERMAVVKLPVGLAPDLDR